MKFKNLIVLIVFGVIILFVLRAAFLGEFRSETTKTPVVEQKKDNVLSGSDYIMRKIIVNNVGLLISTLPEIMNLNEILGKNHTQAEELKYLVALIEERMERIWKKDKDRNCYFIDPAIWQRMPYEQKEQILYVIYREENTWWEIYDMYSGKCLGKVSSWGVKVYP